MSYLLQGSGSLLGPCIGNLLGRELTRFAPCVCIRCAKLISIDRGKIASPTNRNLRQYYSTPPPPSPLATPHNTAPLSQYLGNLDGLDEVRRRFPSDQFRQKYYTSFSSQLGLLGAPVSVNLNFTCGPDISNTGIQYRFLHTSPVVEKKASSKLEETVIRLKERQEETLSELSKVEDLEKKIQNVIERDEQLSQAVKVSVEQKKQLTSEKPSIWQRFVEECKHYYSGFKLLFLDVKVSSKIIWKVLHGNTLSRRENRQLVRTVSDLFRLVPFSVFIIVPFMELLLPVALKLFPGMLPSTFTSQDERENKMRRTLKAKLEYAKFLQQTLDEMSPTGKGYKSQSARDFVSFYKSVKQEGTPVTNKEILKFSKLFEDEITLDNMTRGQLIALCRLLELTPMGTNAFLRFQLEMQLRKLKTDDKLIAREGIEAMSVAELQVANKERGMRALGLTKERLSTQLKQWIELSTNEKVPPSLLLLSRTLYLPDSINPATQIAAAVSALPETAATGAKAKLGEREGKIENVTRLELIKAEQAKIEEEANELVRVQAEKKRKDVELKEKQSRLAQAALGRAIEEQSLGVPPPPATPTAQAVVTEAVSILRKATVSSEGVVQQTGEAGGATDDIHIGHVIQEVSSSGVKTASPISKELSAEDLTALKNALDTISKEKGKKFISEHEVLLELKQELTDYEEDLGELKEQAELSGRGDLAQSKGAARLFTRVNRMLNNINTVVSKLEHREKTLETQIDKLEEAGAATKDQEGHLVTVQELIQAVKQLQEVPDSSRLERIGEVVARMDDDSDGIVKVEHVNKVIELLGRDNVNLSTKQVKQIIELIGKEEMLEVESRIEKILGKLPMYPQKLGKDVKKDELVDNAKDLTEGKPEPHIAQLFSRPVRLDNQKFGVAESATAVPESAPKHSASSADQSLMLTEHSSSTKAVEDNSSTKAVEDNSVTEVTEKLEERETAKVLVDQKVTRTNGSKH